MTVFFYSLRIVFEFWFNTISVYSVLIEIALLNVKIKEVVQIRNGIKVCGAQWDGCEYKGKSNIERLYS